jgi:hypothetical protein
VVEMEAGLVIFGAVLVAVDLLVLMFGADTRDANDWANHPRP